MTDDQLKRQLLRAVDEGLGTSETIAARLGVAVDDCRLQTLIAALLKSGELVSRDCVWVRAGGVR